MKEIIVIGAGPAGMMAAGVAAASNAKVTLFEKNKVLGRKLSITGKGRCNVTNNCEDINEIIRYIPRNGKFLYSALKKFDTHDTIRFFEQNDVPLKTERGNRVFPISDRAMDIVDAMQRFIVTNGVNVLHDRVRKIIIKDNKACGVLTYQGNSFFADAVILCSGGASYPRTGSTGDGYILAKDIGHTVTDISPSLVPLVMKDSFYKELQGLSLKNISIKLLDSEKNKIIYEDFGEMLFTHFGVSGPVILSASAHIENIKPGKYFIEIDMKPALTFEQLDKRITRDFQKNLHKNLANSLGALLPKKMIPVAIKIAGISQIIKCENITKEMRHALVNVIKKFVIEIQGFRPITEAIVTRGGIPVSEIFPSTMESRIIKSLFFAGEIIDVDAYTGGFNLQIAFATGHLAGESAFKIV